ncbi:MAG: RHS repeat domain-containing protein [Bacteroidota bacterium]
MKPFLLLVLLVPAHFSHAQPKNDKKILIQSKVKSSLERHCFQNSEETCSIIYEVYDRRGNTVEWDMGRLGIRYRSAYDIAGNQILKLWIDKLDTTQIDTFKFLYDQHKHLVEEITPDRSIKAYEHLYDKKGQLIKTISKRMNGVGNIVQETIERQWTHFGKQSKKVSTTLTFEVNHKTEIHTYSRSQVEFDYDLNHNLIQETHYSGDTVSKTITYSYDDQNRLLEKLDDDPYRIGLMNRRPNLRRESFEVFRTAYTYNEKGQISGLFTYFMDPCMSLDNHFLYKPYYQENGLLSYIDVYEYGKLRFSIEYDYEYYEVK